KVVDRELNDETVIKEQLLELQMRLELNEISEDDFRAREQDLFARLRAIKERQLDMLGQVHTSETSSMTIEIGGDQSSDSH
ncbi:MAG TPA: gas vesicle protein GvpG, partial [Blastocatellia bacterium]|nr:gas vesicle protein GvpG [Blastocatellia bacterium]